MQWAFVAFLMGHSLEGLLHWRAILLLLLGSFAYPQGEPTGPQLYCPALKVQPACFSSFTLLARLTIFLFPSYHLPFRPGVRDLATSCIRSAAAQPSLESLCILKSSPLADGVSKVRSCSS